MNNPFQFGEIVRENDDFCPRKDLEKRLRGVFESGKNAVARGERRVGKTSLIHRVARKIRGKRLIYVDLRGVKSADDILERAIRSLEAIEKPPRLMERLARVFPNLGLTAAGGHGLTLAFSGREILPEDLSRLGDLWAGLDAQRRIIVVLDEFQDVADLPEAPGILAAFRKEIRRLRAIPFCLAGSGIAEMERLLASPDSPLEKSAVNVDVGQNGFDKWPEFLLAKFQSGNRKIDRETLDGILERAGHNPGDTQQLCAAIWDRTARNRRIDEDVVLRGLDTVFRNEHKLYEHLVTSSSAQQFAVLRTLAHLGGGAIQAKPFLQDTGITHASSVKAAMTRLVERRLVFHDGDEYRFANPFFKNWMLQVGI